MSSWPEKNISTPASTVSTPPTKGRCRRQAENLDERAPLAGSRLLRRDVALKSILWTHP
jgi:hypothetical protein